MNIPRSAISAACVIGALLLMPGGPRVALSPPGTPIAIPTATPFPAPGHIGWATIAARRTATAAAFPRLTPVSVRTVEVRP